MIEKEDAYYYDSPDDPNPIFMEEVAVARLLEDGIVFLCDATLTATGEHGTGIAVNTNDLFLPGGDAEAITPAELENFYRFYVKDDTGPAIWSCMRRKMAPRRRVWGHMKEKPVLWELFPEEMKQIGEWYDGHIENGNASVS